MLRVSTMDLQKYSLKGKLMAETRIIKVGVRLGLQGCKIESELEVETDSSPEEIEEWVREWALQHVEWWSRDA